MKTKLLALAITTALLSGCNDSNGELQSFSIQAFDPAIYNINITTSCNDGTIESAPTNATGIASFTSLTIINSPGSCEFTATGTENSFDITNSKIMAGVVYKAPKGLAQSNSLVTISPLTTLIYRELDGDVYNDSTASNVIAELGLDSLVDGDTSISELLLNTASVVAKLKTANATDYSKLLATTGVLSDVLTNANTSVSVADIATSTTLFTDFVLTSIPNYPLNTTNQVQKVALPGTLLTEVLTEVQGGDFDINSTLDELVTITLPTLKDIVDDGEELEITVPPTTTGGTGTGGSGA
jgi:hypothetical protein